MSASNRSLLFLLGLVLGLLAGAGFFIFKMDDILKSVNILNSSKDTLIIQQQQVVTEAETKKNKTSVKKHFGQNDSSMSSAELLAKKYSREVPIRRVMAEADSLLKDTSFGATQSSPDNFIVRKDEMLGSRNFEVTNLQSTENANASDSLMEKISGIKDTKNVVASFKVEFWQSPINYKGYKMIKNKIVLFGIGTDEVIRLFHSEDAIFMKLNQGYVKLYFTDEFKQFEKVSDASVIAKLK